MKSILSPAVIVFIIYLALFSLFKIKYILYFAIAAFELPCFVCLVVASLSYFMFALCVPFVNAPISVPFIFYRVSMSFVFPLGDRFEVFTGDAK